MTQVSPSRGSVDDAGAGPAPVAPEAQIEAILDGLTLDELIAVTTGADSWATHPLPGMRPIVFSDGPAGVRGVALDERNPSVSLPSPSALAATWDPVLAHDYGSALAGQARERDVDVVLGPMVNIQRSPFAGRHFESLSEDPHLTAVMATHYVRGLQDHGVGACVKHYVANDSETERFHVSAQISERALREVHLLPFEETVAAGAWSVMSAYNAVNGVTMSENDLLASPLVDEWGFDGLVVSDWGAVRSLAAAHAHQDLTMPGPDGPWGAALREAVLEGVVPLEVVREKVRRILRLGGRVGALTQQAAGTTGGDAPAVPAVTAPGGARGVARNVAVRGSVLLHNTGVLPITTAAPTIAVIGEAMLRPKVQGAGSSQVMPEQTISPIDALRHALPDGTVEYHQGVAVNDGLQPFPVEQTRIPGTDAPGVRLRLRDSEGAVVVEEERSSTHQVWIGNFPAGIAAVEMEFDYTPSASASIAVSAHAPARVRLSIDGAQVLDADQPTDGNPLGLSPIEDEVAVVHFDVEAGVSRRVCLVVDVPDYLPLRLLDVMLGIHRHDDAGEVLIAQAVEAARLADVAVVAVAGSRIAETEGTDRETLRLPEAQDALVEAVAAVNPRTVVVVMAGAPVVMPWKDRVGATLLTWFGGQEIGSALADMLTGVVEPGGRLPTTWPAAEDDGPVLTVTPQQGLLHYDEEIHVGYRGWLRAGAEPAYPFGWGLGYTRWSRGEPVVEVTDGPGLRVRIPVTNTGTRPGEDVVQVYLSRPDTEVDYPYRWLAGFMRVAAEPGHTVLADIDITPRSLARWDDQGWVIDAGAVEIHVGGHVLDTQTVSVTVPGAARLEDKTS